MKKILCLSAAFLFIIPFLAYAENTLIFGIASGYDTNYNNEDNKRGSLFYEAKIEGSLFLNETKNHIITSGFLFSEFTDYKNYNNKLFISPGLEFKKNFNDMSSGLKLYSGFARDNNDKSNEFDSFSANLFFTKIISEQTDIGLGFLYSKYFYSQYQGTADYNTSYGYHGGRTIAAQYHGGTQENNTDFPEIISDNGKENADFFNIYLYSDHYINKNLTIGENLGYFENHSNFSINSYSGFKAGFYIDLSINNSFFITPETSFSFYDYKNSTLLEKLFSSGLKTGFFLTNNTIVYINLLYDKLKSENDYNNYESMEIKCGISFFI
ncbi:MAG: hypothetical protein RBR08_11165 [Desulforegulaceae bacterium]|nr:hypothetical protein [Desulforegulaceae bacterium]